MADFPIFHGITLASNAFIENLVVEKLAADPTPVEAGRVWYNTTDKVFRQSTLDTNGAVIVRTFATAEDLAAEIARAEAAEGVLASNLASEISRATAAEGVLTSNLASEISRATAAEGVLTSNLAAEVSRATAAESAITSDLLAELSRATAAEAAIASDLSSEVSRATSAEQALGLRIDALGSAFNYVGTVSGGADAGSAYNLSSLVEKDAGDYYKVAVAGYFKVGAGAAFYANTNDGLVWNLANGIDKIDNTDSSVAGTAGYITVTGSTDSGFVVDADVAFKGRVSTLESGLAQEITDRAAADTALDGRVTTVESQVNGKIGNLSTLTTTEKGTLVGAINELDADLAAEVSARTSAITSVRSDYNAKRFTYESATAATTHTISHNLNASFVDFNVLVQRPNGLYRNDVVSVEEFDSNTLKVYLASAQKIKMAVTSMASL